MCMRDIKQGCCLVQSAASPVIANLLNQSRDKNGKPYLKISGVPYQPVHMFLRFLYSSWYVLSSLCSMLVSLFSCVKLA